MHHRIKKSLRAMAVLSLGFTQFWISASHADFPDTMTIDNVVTDGTVKAIVQAGSRVYIGGSFTQVAFITGNGAPVDSTTGAKDTVFPKIAGPVNAAAPDGIGGWFIGGDFSTVGTTTRHNLAHILSNGTLDLQWNPDADGAVNTLAVSGDRVYVGGLFKKIGGTSRWYIAAVSASGSGALDTQWNPPNPTGEIKSLAVAGTKVYVGGVFSALGPTPRNCLAALSTANPGNVDLVWDPNVNFSVFSLAVSGSKVYLGGWFTTVGALPRNHVAVVDAGGTGTVDPVWNPNVNGEVMALAVSADKVYLGGKFTKVGVTDQNYLASVNSGGTGALDTQWKPTPNNWVFTLALNGTKLYMGGHFTSVGGTTRNNLAAVNATGTGLLDPQWNPSANGDATTLAVSGTKVYVGGTFGSLGGTTRNNLAVVDAGTGNLDLFWHPNVNGNVSALAVNSGKVYLGGAFTSVGGTARQNLAAVDAAGTGSIDSQWDPSPNASINSLAVSGSKVYLGGFFTSIKGTPLNYLAAVEATGTGAAYTQWKPNPNSIVTTLEVSGDKIYAGGSFTSVGGLPRNRLGAVDAGGAGAVDLLWNPNANGSISALTVSGNKVYLAGYFTTIGGTPRTTLAAVNTTTGALDPWTPSVDKRVYALAVSGTKVYLGGDFTTVGGTARPSLAAVDASGTGTLDTQWDPSAATRGGIIYSLTAQGTNLLIGGSETVGWFTDSSLVAPNAPASGAITTVSATGVQATWSLSALAQTYTLAAALTAALPPVSPVAKTGITSLTDTVTGLTPNTAYYISVNANNSSGSSAYRALGSTLTLSAVPTGLQTSGITTTQVTLSWEANGNPNNTTYILQQSSDGGATYAEVYSGTALTFLQSGLVSGTSYLFRVLSRNSADTPSAPTTPKEVTLPPPAPPSGNITGTTPNRVSAQWGISNGAATYTLAAALTAALPPVSPISKSGIVGLTDTVTGLTPNTAYYLSVSACNTAACSAYTALGSTVTPTAIPTGLQTNSRTLTTVTLAWSSAGNAAGTIYILQQSDDAGATFFEAARGTATQVTVDQLEPEHTYHFRVIAQAIPGGTSSYTNVLPTTTAAVAADVSRMRASPNPTAGPTVIENLPAGTQVTLYTMTGQQVRQLPSPSDGRTTWDGKNESGESVASGIYQAVATGTGTKTIKIAVQR